MRSRRLLGSIAVVSLASAFIPSLAHAQTEVIPAREFETASASSRALLARWIARTGVLSLRSAGDPSTNDYRLTAHALELAHQLDPNSLDLLRRQIDAWHGARDREREINATAQLVQRDPNDRVAQLRLISSRIGAIQIAEDRMSAYDRLLGPAGERLDPSIRSRLAFDAALLAREQGDNAGFIRRLTQATQLDSSNKDAAVLAATIVLESSDDPLARAEALLNVIMADPMDASSHANLTRELRSRGAFRTALRFQLNTDSIHTYENRMGDVGLAFERILSYWGMVGPEDVVRLLDERERAVRSARAREIELYQSYGQQPPAGSPAEEVTLEPELEILRAAANLALGRNDRVGTSAALLTKNIAQAQQVIAEYQRQGADPARLEQASEQLRSLFSDLLWMRLWSGVQVAEAETLLRSMRENNLLTDPRVITRYEGFISLWKRDFGEAERRLSGLAEADPRARIGMALLEEARGNPRAAASHLAHLAMGQTGSMLGLYARSRIEVLLGEPVRPGAVAVRLDEYFKSVPEWLDRMTRDPSQFMSLEAVWPSESISVLDGLPLIVRVRNIGRIPLAVGPNSPINSRLLLSPEPTIGGQKSAQRLSPEVIEFNRALRIMPGETVEMLVQTDLGPVGATIDNATTQIVTLRWQLAQGFLVDDKGKFHKGPMSLSGSTRLLTRRRISIPDESSEGYRRALEGAQGDAVIDTLLVGRDLIARSAMASDRQAANQFAAEILAATALRMPRMNAVERANAVILIGSIFPRELVTPIDTIAFQDPSELVRATALLMRVSDPAHPLFDSLEGSSSESMKSLAASMRMRLRVAAEFAERMRQQQQQQQQQQRPGAPQPRQQPQAPGAGGGGGGLRFDPN